MFFLINYLLHFIFKIRLNKVFHRGYIANELGIGESKERVQGMSTNKGTKQFVKYALLSYIMTYVSF